MGAPASDIRQLREAYYRRIASNHLKPLWEVLDVLVPEHPHPKCQPVMWKFADLRPPLLEAGTLISAKEATRRVLMLENPAFPNEARITNSLYAGVQLLNPGEVAPSHRHTQSALRFILEGSNAFTAVDGERAWMAPGDLILTPSWTWHDHGSESKEPMIWLDGLDIPIMQLFDAGFMENYPADQHPTTREVGDAQARYGANMLPVNHTPRSLTSPVFHYPYARTREALERLSKSTAIDPHEGVRMKYINPVTGGHAMPTIATFMQLLPAGFNGKSFRTTDATVYVCVEGSGSTHVGDKRFDWTQNDIFVAPSWYPVRHVTNTEAVLFSYSDRVVQEQLGLWRERRE